MKNLVKNAVLVAVAKTIKGTSFVGLRNYANQQGEVSNYTILAGISYENCLEHDFKSLKENSKSVFETLVKDHTYAVVEQAYNNVFNSLNKRLSSEEVKEALRLQNDATIRRSDAQINLYVHLAKGIKRNVETNEIVLFGLQVKKTVIKPIEYKTVNSRELTIVQNKIKKLCNFKQDKYKTFTVNESEINLQGLTIK